MRIRATTIRLPVLSRAVGIAVLAVTGAACSGDATRVREPLITGSTDNQRAIIGSAQPASSSAIARSDLPPPTGAPASDGWSAANGSVVTVAAGESLDTLAIKYGVPSAEIARANGISSPSQLTPGRTIVIPARVAAAYAPSASGPASASAAPVAASPAAASAGVRSSGVIHIVESGQTLYSIARAQGVSVEEIVALNGLSSTNIQGGQRLKIPPPGGATPTQTVALTNPNPSPTRGAPPKTLGTLTVKGSDPSAPPIAGPADPSSNAAPAVRQVTTPPPAGQMPTLTASAPAADPPSKNGTTFRWPVQGRIISGFGSKPDGERNDGINLAVPEGTPVKAAEAGTVIYSGSELAGYGNLVLVRHADGWVSAYAHNNRVLVNKGDQVTRGQTIGEAGMTGSVNAPQLHFELRKGAKPVNPLDYLAGA